MRSAARCTDLDGVSILQSHATCQAAVAKPRSGKLHWRESSPKKGVREQFSGIKHALLEDAKVQVRAETVRPIHIKARKHIISCLNSNTTEPSCVKALQQLLLRQPTMDTRETCPRPDSRSMGASAPWLCGPWSWHRSAAQHTQKI